MHRSLLFVPGSRPDRFDKALASRADAVIVDLEDAVPPEQKSAARDALASWLHPERPVIVRINAAGTPWFEEDCRLAGLPGIAAVMVPKAERSEEIWTVAQAGRPVFALIETASGCEHVNAIARTEGVTRLVFGSIDLQLDMGIEGDDDELLLFRSSLVLASRLADLPAPVDGVTVAIADEASLAAAARRARRMGFGAKLCIHPQQVAAVNAAFTPSEQDIAWAQRVLAAASASAGAATIVDGRMVDRPVILRAERIVQPGTGR